MPITPFDDYPVHQTPLPVAHPASGDPNHYDRYFFNGYDRDGGWFFGVALGVYPNRHVIDAAFSVVRDGVQRSVFASGRLPLDRPSKVGPISIEIVRPLGENRVRVEAGHLGVEADLVWRPRTAAIEEPRQTLVAGTQTVMDATRLTQWGTWDGRVVVDGSRIDAQHAPGTKDRSWGVRPVGDPVPGVPAAFTGTAFFWAPIHLDDRCTHLAAFERPDGERWYSSAGAVPLLGPDDDTWGAEVRHAHAEVELRLRPGTRRSDAATIAYTFPDGERLTMELEPVLDFQMKGLGYFHPSWQHGRWHGESADGSDAWTVADLDPLEIGNIHVEQLCRVRCDGREGIGVLEQLIIGPHAPSGLEGFLDGA